MPIFTRILARLLRRSDAIIPNLLVRAHRLGNVAFARELEADGEGTAVLHCLAGALGGGGQERVRGVADERYAGFGGDPGRERIAVDEFPVYAGRGGAHDGADDGVPSFEDVEGVLDVAGLLPAFFDIGVVLPRARC